MNCWIKSKNLQLLNRQWQKKIKKAKAQKMCHKNKIQIWRFRNCLEATQLGNKINYLGKNKVDTNSIKKDYKEFIKSNKLILKTHQIFKS